MNLEIEARFKEQFPIFLRDMYGDPMKTCMAFGFECGNGWEKPLKELCEKIEAVNKNSKVGHIIADQIKEKFGELRVYYHIEPLEGVAEELSWDLADVADRYIRDAEEQCAVTCEICGKKWRRVVQCGALCVKIVLRRGKGNEQVGSTAFVGLK